MDTTCLSCGMDDRDTCGCPAEFSGAITVPCDRCHSAPATTHLVDHDVSGSARLCAACDEHRLLEAALSAPDLDALLVALRAIPVDVDTVNLSLPSFGGDDPCDTDAFPSWDETRLLVRICGERRWRLLPRDEADEMIY